MSMLMRRAFMGGSTGFTYATLNPADKSSNISLSGGDLSFSSTVDGSVRATMSKTSGKWQFEVTVTGLTSTTSGMGVGGSSGIALTSYPGGTTDGWGLLVSGDIRRGGSTTQVATSYTIGDVITCAIDCGGNAVAWYKNGVADGSAAVLSSATTAPFPMVGGRMSGTCNFGASPLAYPVAGYNLGVYI